MKREKTNYILSGASIPSKPKEDFRVLCANCHRMVHSKNPPYTIEELKAKFKQ